MLQHAEFAGQPLEARAEGGGRRHQRQPHVVRHAAHKVEDSLHGCRVGVPEVGVNQARVTALDLARLRFGSFTLPGSLQGCPLGGMGLNGGVHDAVNLAEKLARIWHGDATPDRLAQYHRQRRGVTIEHVQRHTITNKQNLEASDPASQQAFRERLAAAAAAPTAARDFLLGVSMINRLRRAAEIT